MKCEKCGGVFPTRKGRFCGTCNWNHPQFVYGETNTMEDFIRRSAKDVEFWKMEAIKNLENADAKWTELYGKYAKLIIALEEIVDKPTLDAAPLRSIAKKALEPKRRGEA